MSVCNAAVALLSDGGLSRQLPRQASPLIFAVPNSQSHPFKLIFLKPAHLEPHWIGNLFVYCPQEIIWGEQIAVKAIMPVLLVFLTRKINNTRLIWRRLALLWLSGEGQREACKSHSWFMSSYIQQRIWKKMRPVLFGVTSEKSVLALLKPKFSGTDFKIWT